MFPKTDHVLNSPDFLLEDGPMAELPSQRMLIAGLRHMLVH